jgi:hypothetical protein
VTLSNGVQFLKPNRLLAGCQYFLPGKGFDYRQQRGLSRFQLPLDTNCENATLTQAFIYRHYVELKKFKRL